MMDQEFLKFFNKYGLIELVHPSSEGKSSIRIRRSILLGGVLIKVAINYRVIAYNNLIEDKELQFLCNSLSNTIKDKVILNFPKTESFLNVKVGNGFTSEEYNSSSFILDIFNLYIYKVFELNDFKQVLNDICELFPDTVNLVNVKDSKTKLQEFLQAKKISLPNYLTDNGKQVTPTTYSYTTHLEIKEYSIDVTGFGLSKRLSQLDAAQKAYEILSKFSKQSHNTFKLSNSFFDLSGNYKSLKGKKLNNYLNDYFGLHKDYNILPAFISLRMKKNGLVSHRRFAMLGSIVLKLFRTIALYASNDYDNDESTRLEVIGSNDFFIKQIKESDFIILSDFPFYKIGGEYINEAYNMDCIQSLFALSFINEMKNDNEIKLNNINKCNKAFKWYAELLDNPTLELEQSNHYIMNNLVKRLQSLGFIIKIRKNEKIFYFSIESVFDKSVSYILDLKLNILEYNREIATRNLVGFVTKTLNRLDGSNMTLPKSNKYLNEICELSSFIIINANRNFNPSEETMKFVQEKNNHIGDLEINDIFEFFSEVPNNLEKFIYIFNILNKCNLIDKDISCLDFIGLNHHNIDFTTKSEEVNSKDELSIKEALNFIAVDEGNAFEETIDLPSKDVIDLTNETQYRIPEFKTEKTEISKEIITDSKLNVDVIPELNLKPSQTRSLESTALLPKELPLAERIKYFNNLNEDELLEIWERREEVLDFAEDAAIVLSLIRFNEGIDREIRKITEIIDFENITCLDLPSLKALSTKSAEKSFEIKENDTRIRKKALLVVRPNQANFRAELISLWKKCPITGCNILEILDAAHIYPYRGEKDNEITNGILLRTDIHKLFDKYLLSIHPKNFTIHISKYITDPQYTQYEGKKCNDFKRLSNDALSYHWMYFLNPNF
ncbi:HNH endonuclease [Acinetobacter sp. 226-4]|uniref:HNH endonuclease n=1 Tax=Acinetobacter sp. 226-4 TaxID=2746719 RepID=UPI0025763F58|nr:HNH endonuclease [Acinetobacter sp. 226-4]MDM1769337.1 HNH endonuclease [Acinetobacter sp. 226-4]